MNENMNNLSNELSDEAMVALGNLEDRRLTFESALLEWKRLMDSGAPKHVEDQLLRIVVDTSSESSLARDAVCAGVPYEIVERAMHATIIKNQM